MRAKPICIQRRDNGKQVENEQVTLSKKSPKGLWFSLDETLDPVIFSGALQEEWGGPAYVSWAETRADLILLGRALHSPPLRFQRQSNTPWSEQDLGEVRHYGATFGGSKFALWCFEPSVSETEEWRGCRMYRVFRSQCHTERGIRSFATWANEIHAWGVRTHGPACQRDLKRSLQSTGVRTSDIGFSET